MSYRFVTDYQNNNLLRQSFFELALATFDIDFKPWFEIGAWDDNYRCYSYADGDQIIANVSVNLMTVHHQGQKKQAVQIGTVMTHPDYQQQGLAGKLMDHVVKHYDQRVAFIYLFANDQVLDFYPKYGFHPYDESQFTFAIDQQWQPLPKNYRQLNCESASDLALLRELVFNRRPNSQRLGISNNPSLLLFYATIVFPHQLYYFEKQHTLIIGEQSDDTITIFDVVQTQKEAIIPLISQLITNETTTGQLFFTTDNQEFPIEQQLQSTTEDHLFIRSQSETWSNQTCFPLTSHG